MGKIGHRSSVQASTSSRSVHVGHAGLAGPWKRRRAGPPTGVLRKICGGVTDGIAYARARAIVDPGRSGVDVPGGSEDRYSLGESGQIERHSHAWRPPPVPRVRGSGPIAGADPSATARRLSQRLVRTSHLVGNRKGAGATAASRVSRTFCCPPFSSRSCIEVPHRGPRLDGRRRGRA